MVIDALNLTAEVHDVAELLYDLLSDPAIHRTKPHLLLACNKQDMSLALSTEAVCEALEEEM